MVGNETNKLVKGALLLTLAGLISKVLSAGYRIPLQNLTGDIGFYIYQQVYPILGIAMILALYGFPSAISKMTIELKEKGESISLKGFFIPIFLILLAVNGAIFLFLFLNAESLALWVGDVNLTHTYRFAAFTFLLIPFTALLRGFFQGEYEMKPTAFSQVGEQFVRVFIIIFAAVYVVIKNQSLYTIGQAAALASIVGGGTAILILGLFFVKRKPITDEQFEIPWNYYVRTLLTLGIVAALNHMVLLVIQFADAFTLIPNLMTFGLSKLEAMEAKGVFDRGQPLIQLGTVLGSSFALALIPSISKQKLNHNPTQFYQYIRGTMLFSFYLAIGATVGLIVIFPEANTLLYQNDKGTINLQIIILAIFLCSIAITASSILQGLGYIKRTAGFILIAFFVKWIGNQIMVPLFGITGAAIATVFSLFLLCTVVLFELKRKLPDLKFFQRINWWALIKATLAMVIYILITDYFFSTAIAQSRLNLLVYVIVIAITGGLIYIFSLLKGRAFTALELRMLPFASFFIRVHKGRNIDGS
ncbi:low temperature requirement protein B [Virgibacillus profundi]|uniref:Low temperature requirement protein B n=1 Tax=Virgibacillus profundi TaxID=2024555 RepID=A0A2A2IA18_9BACI|nr:polysaccharide biosynthesis protein [Virgibacillus profundi]PAV28569.1 low temperature requirement protein B [Virgibacillus profundi]PXY52742.1 polysaccharide biosynthesis protein [Virgibacillus profundi]